MKKTEKNAEDSPKRTAAVLALEDKMKGQIIDYLKTHLPPGYKIVRKGETAEKESEFISPREVEMHLGPE